MLCLEAAGLKVINHEDRSMKSDPFISMAVMITVATVVLSVIDASMISITELAQKKSSLTGSLIGQQRFLAGGLS